MAALAAWAAFALTARLAFMTTLTAWAAVPSVQEAVRLLGLAHRELGPTLTGFEMMGSFALSLVAKHFPKLRVPFYEQSPYCVLLESSDHESESHARAQLERAGGHFHELANSVNVAGSVCGYATRVASVSDVPN